MSDEKSLIEREILEQPEALRRLLDAERDHVREIAAAVRARQPKYIVFDARGTSDNAARYGQYLFGAFNRLPVVLATPSLFTLYDQAPDVSDALIIGVSQSGQSPDIVTVLEEGRRQGALTIAINNSPDSPLAQAAEFQIPLHAGREYAVAATKSYTTSLMALAMLSSALSGDDARFAELERVPDFVSQVTAHAAETIAAAERYRYMNLCVVLSRGFNYATAFEAALKLKEMTYIIAEPYSTSDFKHGPVAMVDDGFPLIAVVPEGKVAGEMEEFLTNLKAQGAELIVISARESALALAETALPLPRDIPEWVSPMVTIVPGQLFALGLTLSKRYNPDNPRGLRKVTLTQ
jgi:glucosamine--fructose-6-phosphate aminotransferase (isomerizing)